MEKVETVEGVTDTYEYFYDIAGRLTDVLKNSVSVGSYTYDSNSNRTSYTPAWLIVLTVLYSRRKNTGL